MITQFLKILPLVLLLAALSACVEKKPERNPRIPAPEDSAAALRTLMSGISGMMNVESYHAVADLELGAKRGRIEGDFAPAKMDFLIERFDSLKRRYRVIQGEAWRSSDNGATWESDTLNEGVSTAMLVLGPVNPKVRLEREGRASVVGFDTIAGQEATHIRIAAASPIDIWVGSEKAGGPIVIRRLRSAFAANDASGYATVNYSKFNATLEIAAPE